MKTNQNETQVLQAEKDLMSEISEKLLQSRGQMSDQQALKDYSREELVGALVEFESQWSFLDYQHSYENDYWLNFVVDLIMDEKINPQYWASRMPSDQYSELIATFTQRLKTKEDTNE